MNIKNNRMDAILERLDLMSLKTFADLFDTDVSTVQRVIRARELHCEQIMDGSTKRLFINVDMFLNRAQSEGLTGADMFKKLARLLKR